MKPIAERSAQAFCSLTLTKPEWTHSAHLRVGLWHVLHHGADEAMDLLRMRIRALNESHSVANTENAGYHETITRFYVWRIASFLAAEDISRPIDELVRELILCYGDKGLPFQYWSKEVLMSTEARLGWVEPDLQPFQ